MRSAGHVACVGEMKNTYRILFGIPEGKRQLRGPRHRTILRLILNKQGVREWSEFILFGIGTSDRPL
jgi:hypothetical protein